MRRLVRCALTRGALAAAGLTCALALASAGARAAPEDGHKYKDWTVRCEQYKNDEQREFDQCHIFQDWHHKERDLRILHVAFAYPPGSPERAIGVLTMPLGIFLPAGVKLQIDKGDTLSLVVERCEPVGCKAGFPLDDALLGELKKGIKAYVTFHDMRRTPITVPVSLRGFTAALGALH